MIQMTENRKKETQRAPCGWWALLIVLMGAACAHRQIIPGNTLDPVHWLAQNGAFRVDDPYADMAVQLYAGELTGSPRLLRILYSAADPVTQVRVREVAAGNLIRLLPPSDWQPGWLGTLVYADRDRLLPVEQIRLARGLSGQENLLTAQEWGRWLSTYGKTAQAVELKTWFAHWAEVEDNDALHDLLTTEENTKMQHRKPQASRLLLPFSGRAAAVGWRLGYDFLAGYLSRNSFRPLFYDDSANRLATAGKLVDSRVALVGPFRRKNVEAYDKWRPGRIQQVVFSASLGRQPGRIEFALRPEVIADNLFDQLYALNVSKVSLVVPASKYGDRFARAFVKHCRKVTDVTLTGLIWYREDLKDVVFQTRLLYGVDRYPAAWLARAKMDPAKVDGVVQQDVSVVVGRPVVLGRLVREMQFQGSTFQAFAGDFGFNNLQLAHQLELGVPLLFIDHFTRGLTGTVQRYARFVSAVAGNRGINLADLMLYEAGQWAGDGYTDAPTVALAGGDLKQNKDGLLQLADYPMMLSGGEIYAADLTLVEDGIARQKRRYEAFQQRIVEKKAEEAESDTKNKGAGGQK